MTFGEQTSEADAHAQLDFAMAQGINFIDTAEMYAVPPRPKPAAHRSASSGAG
jgi:aryl-alcohol dehydrogenase-like predicted oxidoreductase